LQGSLFTRDFLLEGIADTEAWKAVPAESIRRFRDAAAAAFKDFPVAGKPNEAQTEDEIIIPVLKALGWDQYLRQPTTRRREDVPDILLLPDADHKKLANAEKDSHRRFRHGSAIAESKAWGIPLDRGAPDLFNQDAPSSQMLRYLTRIEIASDRAIQWGILTNGRLWRLYYQGAKSRSEEFLELDLAVLADVPQVQPDLGADEAAYRDHLVKVFYLLFRRDAFLPSAEDGRPFLLLALSLTREWEAQVSQKLSEDIFEGVFPRLVAAIVEGDRERPKTPNDAYLDEARRAALTLLYRLLFVFYAEDRNLLPAHDPGYEDYSLRKLRTELQERIDRGGAFSARATAIWDRLKTVFRLIDGGDTGIGLPPYNGGLFDTRQHALLGRVQLGDDVLGHCLDALSRRKDGTGGEPKRINYRDLSVQHLGSIYERLLEYRVVAPDGKVVVELGPFARKGSGSYYTHDDLVRLIIQRTIGPLIAERQKKFEETAEKLKSDSRPISRRVEDVARLDPAERILDLKICDPSMGSGHFLVSLVDYLADEILEALGGAAEIVDWSDPRQPYLSPLTARIGEIRRRIRAEADKARWKIDDAQLDDKHIVRRMILKRCVYGVDKNSMAVELAKVALWLHTFTAGAPLSFLDHHLRSGDSLFGEWVRPVEDMLVARGGMFLNPSVAQAKNSAKGMLDVERLTDADIVEVKNSKAAFEGVEQATAPLNDFMSLVHALRWLATDTKQRIAVDQFYDGQFGDPIAIAGGAAPVGKGADAFTNLLAEARTLQSEQHFLHWEVAFPGVWTDWESTTPDGGFDAVIGNPPWDRMKLQEVEWFATRRPEIALSVRASDRRQKVEALKKKRDPLWNDYERAKNRAERAVAIARDSGDYPLLSGGDVNIYSLFVERAQRLIRSDGIVGFLVPSGIASDLTASKFFKAVATAGRIAALFDFENRWPTYFPDVDSRFKFSVFVVGGGIRTFAHTDCAFFLHETFEAETKKFALGSDDFARVNPNTGTAPVFRSQRDADIVRGIYERLPVLIRHTGDGNQAVWPVRYIRMFDMTNDAGLFRTRAELEADGFYLVANAHRLRKGDREFLPLYVGKSIQQFDHRSASADVNEENLHVAASSSLTTLDQHKDPSFFPSPQFWVASDDLNKRWPAELDWLLGFRDIARATDARTVIASIIPKVAVGNTLPLLLPADGIEHYKASIPLLLAQMNSMVLDYVARQKVQSTHLNWYIAEQLPFLSATTFDRKIGSMRISEFIQREVMRLTYTADDMVLFARDMGYDGPPFAWDEDDRRHRRARLDALFFRLYGVAEDDAAYVLDTFPIVRQQDETQFRRFLTKDLILAYMRAIAAGDLTSIVSV
jgi:hypothetical protein